MMRAICCAEGLTLEDGRDMLDLICSAYETPQGCSTDEDYDFSELPAALLCFPQPDMPF